jgi:voltage-gated sodium channel
MLSNSEKESNIPYLFREGPILALILCNVLVIYLHTFNEFYEFHDWLDVMDIIFTIFFAIEVIYKIVKSKGSIINKFNTYFANRWNRLDFTAIVLSLPSIAVFLAPNLAIFVGFSVLRSLRIFKLLRVVEFIPDGRALSAKLFKAFQKIEFVVIIFFIYTTVVSLISVTLFKNSAPKYFGNAYSGFFTIFKVFSGDGFSEVVAEIEIHASIAMSFFAKFYFVAIVFSGSILGLSLINSIFIDQMNHVASEIDKQELNEIKKVLSELHEIKKELNTLKSKLDLNTKCNSDHDK